MSKVNGITLRLGSRPWELYVVPKNYGSVKYVRAMSDSQIILAFILIALYMPRGFSTRMQLTWLRDYVDLWAGAPNNKMVQALDLLSKTSLERYMHVAHEAELILPDGTTTEFGAYLQANLESARKAFQVSVEYSTSLQDSVTGGSKTVHLGAMYEDDTNSSWIVEATGIQMRSSNFYTPKENVSTSSHPALKREYITPYERFMGWVGRLFS